MLQLEKLLAVIKNDPSIVDCLQLVASLKLNDWYLSAGFIGNFIWDGYFNKPCHEVIADINVIYFAPDDREPWHEQRYKPYFVAQQPRFHWSVKNQARMYLSNGDPPYSSSLDAMSYWPEIQTAIGVSLGNKGEIIIASPFLSQYQVNKISRNKKCLAATAFRQRLESRFWLSRWPALQVED